MISSYVTNGTLQSNDVFAGVSIGCRACEQKGGAVSASVVRRQEQHRMRRLGTFEQRLVPRSLPNMVT